MRTIIAGSRDCTNMLDLAQAVSECGWKPGVVLSGTARGADRLGEIWAAAHDIPVERYPANWGLHGKSAGYKRNAEMAGKAEALIALWDGQSRGTAHMIELARKAGLRVHVYVTRKGAENPEIPSRFSSGQEVCCFLGVNPEKLVFVRRAFCPMCDSNIHDSWTIDGKIELRHLWDADKTKTINPKEEQILFEYLEALR